MKVSRLMSAVKLFPAAHLFGLFFLFSGVQAANFTVSNIADLQNSLMIAATNTENDTINVMAGTYSVNSTLTFWSDEDFSILLKGQGTPVFNGNDATQIMEFITVSNQGHILIEGLNIQHGTADYGGGLYLETENANINLTNCTIEENTAGYVGGGANIYSQAGNITVENCIFSGNSSLNSSGYPYGTAGGLFVQTEGSGTEIKVLKCLFEKNEVERDGAGAMLYPVGSSSTVLVENSFFNDNMANEFGGGCWIRCPAGDATVQYRNNSVTGNSSVEAGSGGGTYIEIASGTMEISDNTHNGNSSVWQGGGLWIEHGGGTLKIQHNVFAANTSDQNGSGGNIFIDHGTATIDHNVFYENESTAESGGGLCIATTTGILNIFNNTFFGNSAAEAGGIYFYFDSNEAQANVSNNILWHDSSPAIAYSGAQTVTVRFSDIENGTDEPWFGIGCIDKKPLFVDPENGDLHISWSHFPVVDSTKSPCIDAGDTAFPFDPDNTIADMGAFYFDQRTTDVKDEHSEIVATSLKLYQNFPNPFNSASTIKYSLSKPSHVKIQIYNMSGQLVETLVNDFKIVGNYEVIWNPEKLTSGTYLYRLDTGNFRTMKKLTLIK